MGEFTKISWTDHTFNPWIGCTRVSPGCVNCYAEILATSRLGVEWGPQASRKITALSTWGQPRRWNRAAKRDGVRRRVFCASLADVFEDKPELTVPRERLFRMIEECDGLDWLLLTKRPDRMIELAKAAGWAGDWPQHVWAGTTVEDQKRADERLPELVNVPAHIRFVSYEPALEAVDFSRWLAVRSICSSCGAEHDGHVPGRCPSCGVDNLITVWGQEQAERLRSGDRYDPTFDERRDDGPAIDWIIVGGESGTKARRFDIAWAESTIEQCRAGQIHCFVKQLGSRPTGERWGRARQYDRPPNADVIVLNDSKGGDMSEWPAQLRVREVPST